MLNRLPVQMIQVLIWINVTIIAFLAGLSTGSDVPRGFTLSPTIGLFLVILYLSVHCIKRAKLGRFEGA